MQKPYIVATDLSPRSDRAVRRAFQLAGEHGVKLIVLSIVDNAMPDHLSASVVKDARSTLKRFLASLEGDRAVDYEVRVNAGDPTADIVATAEDADAALLIFGVHRPRPFLDALRETTMQRIVRRTACPVLLVTDQADHPYETVVAAVDFSPASTAALIIAQGLLPNSRILPAYALHVPYQGMLAASPAANTQLAAAFLKEARRDRDVWAANPDLPADMAEVEILEGSAFSVLREFAKSSGADLVTVGAHGRVGAAPAILGSLASDLMRDPPCDVLIARPDRNGTA